jgi:beta-N-acetylhexosaminidase
MNMKSVIYGCEALALTIFEREFFKSEQPFGLILFKRNCETPSQVRELITSFREIVGRDDAPVLIDQEGGRVQRLKAPFCGIYPPAKTFADLYSQNAAKARRAAFLGMRLIGHDLHDLGINVNCVPCADLYFPFAHDIIGDRSYGAKPEQAAALASAAFEGLRASGVAGVLKHIPGHGRALADSHHELPVVKTSISELKRTDFKVFKLMQEVGIDFAMTAHVVYDSIDKECATFSKPVIDKIIRSHIGFPEYLMTDDLSMKALSGSFESRVQKSYAAGCDIILHCNGERAEMEAIASETRDFKAEIMSGYMYDAFDVEEARAEFHALIAK